MTQNAFAITFGLPGYAENINIVVQDLFPGTGANIAVPCRLILLLHFNWQAAAAIRIGIVPVSLVEASVLTEGVCYLTCWEKQSCDSKCP